MKPEPSEKDKGKGMKDEAGPRAVFRSATPSRHPFSGELARFENSQNIKMNGGYRRP